MTHPSHGIAITAITLLCFTAGCMSAPPAMPSDKVSLVSEYPALHYARCMKACCCRVPASFWQGQEYSIRVTGSLLNLVCRADAGMYKT
jgi:hypothetical protein